jgi:hypothetical protein
VNRRAIHRSEGEERRRGERALVERLGRRGLTAPPANDNRAIGLMPIRRLIGLFMRLGRAFER